MNLGRYKPQPLPQLIPAAAAPGAIPGAAPTSLDAMPVLYPAGPTPHGFLYQQLQGMPFVGSAQTWTAGQIFSLPHASYALQLRSSEAAPLHKRVVTRWADTWEVGTNSQLDGIDLDYYWLDLTHNALRMRLDTDGQLSLLGYAMAGGVPINGVVNVPLNLETRPFGSAPAQVGLGVGILFRLADANAVVVDSGAINLITDNVMAGATMTHFDFYVNNAGSPSRVAGMSPNNLTLFAGGAPATVTSMLTLRNGATPTAIGAGTMIDFLGFDGGGNFIHWGRQVMVVTDASSGAANTSHAFTAQHGGTEVEVCRVRGAGMAATNAGGTAVVTNVGGSFQISGNLEHKGTGVGFYGATPATKPAVTGSRGGNAALASLLTQLATLGLITDSSS